MALEYYVFSGLFVEALCAPLAQVARTAGSCWTHAEARPPGDFDADILRDEGYGDGFFSRAYIRFDKFQSAAAMAHLKVFVQRLPEPKVVLFQMDPTEQAPFRDTAL